MNYLPSPELREILLPAYNPCSGFQGACKGVATWNPKQGHVPRGFIGAIGSLDEVQLVLLVAEPGDPHGEESYVLDDEPMTQISEYVSSVYQTGKDLYHRNLRLLLDLVFPNETLEQQLRKVWITETYLCSAQKEGGSVPRLSERGCSERFLAKQLELFKDRPVIALGRKAQHRAKAYSPNLIEAYSVAPPGCNFKPARPSWEAAAKEARRRIDGWR